MATSSLSAIDDVTMTVIVKFKSGSTISTIWSVTCDVVNISSRVVVLPPSGPELRFEPEPM
jgi:hypothetical protein